MAVGSLVSLLVLLIILVLVCIVAKWFIGYMEIPHPISTVVLVLVGLLCLLVFLRAIGVLDLGTLKL